MCRRKKGKKRRDEREIEAAPGRRELNVYLAGQKQGRVMGAEREGQICVTAGLAAFGRRWPATSEYIMIQKPQSEHFYSHE